MMDPLKITIHDRKQEWHNLPPDEYRNDPNFIHIVRIMDRRAWNVIHGIPESVRVDITREVSPVCMIAELSVTYEVKISRESSIFSRLFTQEEMEDPGRFKTLVAGMWDRNVTLALDHAPDFYAEAI